MKTIGNNFSWININLQHDRRIIDNEHTMCNETKNLSALGTKTYHQKHWNFVLKFFKSHKFNIYKTPTNPVLHPTKTSSTLTSKTSHPHLYLTSSLNHSILNIHHLEPEALISHVASRTCDASTIL